MKDDNIKKETPKIHLEIGELILHGFDYHTKQNVSSEIEKELARLIRENGLQYGSNDIHKKPSLVSKYRDLHSANTKSVGSQVAHSIYKNLTNNDINHKMIEDNDQMMTRSDKINRRK